MGNQCGKLDVLARDLVKADSQPNLFDHDRDQENTIVTVRPKSEEKNHVLRQRVIVLGQIG